MTSMLSGRRARLVALLIAASVAISVLAVAAAGSSMAYYATPEEFAAHEDPTGQRWRVGGRVVRESVVEQHGRPVHFEIVGEAGERVAVDYDGIVPGLFGPHAFVVVEGVAESRSLIAASNVIIKHEDEFFSDMPPPDSPSHKLVPTQEPGGAQPASTY